ncbi:MAG: SH3 domain-containing protein [Candidatus Ozemobacteraceae bacterium]
MNRICFGCSIILILVPLLLGTSVPGHALDLQSTLDDHTPTNADGTPAAPNIGQGGDSTESEGTVKVSSSLNIRTSPWGKIVGKFHNGDKVKIIGSQGDWYKIKWNGKTVYCHKNYIMEQLVLPGLSRSPKFGVCSSENEKPVSKKRLLNFAQRIVIMPETSILGRSWYGNSSSCKIGSLKATMYCLCRMEG